MHYLRRLSPEYQDINLANMGFMVVQGDSFYFNKAGKVIEYLRDKKFDIVDYEFKQVFSESDKEEMYLNNLNNKKNYWWFGKEVFELGPSLGIILRKTDSKNIFEDLTDLKGNADPLINKGQNIRNDLGAFCISYNLIHTSDNLSEMLRESSLFFSLQRLRKLKHNCIPFGWVKKEIEAISPLKNADVYQCFLNKIFMKSLSIYRNYIMDDKKIFDFLNSVYSEDKIVCSEEQIEFFLKQIKSCIWRMENINEHLIFLSFINYFERLIKKEFCDFNWEVFWDICRINEIKINREDELIITAGKTFGVI